MDERKNRGPGLAYTPDRVDSTAAKLGNSVVATRHAQTTEARDDLSNHL